MKKYLLMSILSLFFVSSALNGCSSTNLGTNGTSISVTSGDTEKITKINTYIDLDNKELTGDATGVLIEDNTISILAGGTYCLSGSLSDGQILVDTESSQDVYIVLNGVNISNSNSSAIYVKNSNKTVIGLADNTENYITDAESYTLDKNSDEPNAAIFSKDDITFIGTGSLEVNGKYDEGITGKDDLRIENGNITVNSKGDGIRGRDSLTITNGNIVINSGADGLKSNNDTDEGKGNVYIEGGSINITADEDGIQGENTVTLGTADINIVTGGGSENAPVKTEDAAAPAPPENMMKPDVPANQTETTTSTETSEETLSTKGIKAASNITINSGTITINSCDDAIHSNDSLIINGGTLNIKAGDDGLHSDTILDINDGLIDISKSYEGIESETININNGNISVVSSDDGINASSTTTTSGAPAEAGTQAEAGAQNHKGMGGSSGKGVLNINGGTLYVDDAGDGLDANGSVYMTGGTVIVCGPTDSGNAALDFDNNFEISGGTLIAAGSAGMAQPPSNTSSQNSLSVTLSSREGGTLVSLQDSNGKDLLTFAPTKKFESIIISSPDLKTGETYKINVGGTSTSSSEDVLYTDGTYSCGEEIKSFTISEVVTSVTQDGVTVKTMGGGGRRMGGGMMNGGERPARDFQNKQ